MADKGVMVKAPMDLKDYEDRRDSVEAKERFRQLIERIYDIYVKKAGSDHGVKAQLCRDFNVSQPTISNWLGQGPKTPANPDGLFKMTDDVANYVKISEILGFSVEEIFFHIFYGIPLGELPGEVRRADRLSQIQALMLLLKQDGNSDALLGVIEGSTKLLRMELAGEEIPEVIPVTYFDTFRAFRDTHFGGKDKFFVLQLTDEDEGINNLSTGISFVGRKEDAQGLLTGDYYPSQEELEALLYWMHDVSGDDDFSPDTIRPDSVVEKVKV
jgi:hypothetical protein